MVRPITVTDSSDQAPRRPGAQRLTRCAPGENRHTIRPTGTFALRCTQRTDHTGRTFVEGNDAMYPATFDFKPSPRAGSFCADTLSAKPIEQTPTPMHRASCLMALLLARGSVDVDCCDPMKGSAPPRYAEPQIHVPIRPTRSWASLPLCPALYLHVKFLE